MSDRELLRLSESTLGAIAERGVPVPTYDRDGLLPRIVHIGLGGFHRAHMALYTDELAAHGSDWGIVGVGLLPHDARIGQVLQEQQHLYVLTEKGDEPPAPKVIGSIVGFLYAPDSDDAFHQLIAAPTTDIVSLTITESGYTELSDADRTAGGRTTLDRLAGALQARREHGTGGVTILSCDNLPGNGTVARRAVLAAAGRVGGGLTGWIEEHCSFPNSMVDRITPATKPGDIDWLRDTYQIDDHWPVVGEPFRQWVIEDDFVCGRPRWEEVGALFTDEVHLWELYKLRMLNATHSSMAYLSALADIVYVDEAMAMPTIRQYLEELLYNEAIPTLEVIEGHPRENYADTVLSRFSSTGVRDQIARLCIDGSAKYPTFLLPTIVKQLELGGPIMRATTALAGWARYLLAVPHEQQAFDASMQLAREYAAELDVDPVRFLDYGEVFPESLRRSDRFRAAFVHAYRTIVSSGPFAAMTLSEG